MNIILIIIAILLFNILVFSHELGHLISAKKFGVTVNEFAVGMGPQIFKIQKGETVYSLRAIPIGGFCLMEGDDKASEKEGAFSTKAPWQRMIIISIGAIINVILGFVLTFFALVGQSGFYTTTISGFSNRAISSRTGLKVGDKILKINNFSTNTFRDINFAIKVDSKEVFDISVLRENSKVELKNVAFKVDDANCADIDFIPAVEKNNFVNLIKQTWLETLSHIKITWTSLIGLITRRFSIKNVNGPVGMALQINQIVNRSLEINFAAGLVNIIMFMALVTVNLGILNLLPFPALDGGRLVFLLIEQIRGKPIPEKYEAVVHTIGFVLLMALTLFATFGDILRNFKFKT